MPLKRPAPVEFSQHSSHSDSGVDVPSKRSKIDGKSKVLPNVNLYIVQAKIDASSLSELFALAERNCNKLCIDIEDADVILTAVTMRRRFERYLSWEDAVGSHFCSN